MDTALPAMARPGVVAFAPPERVTTGNSGRIPAAGASIAIHLLLLALVAGLAGPNSARMPVHPLEVMLLRAPRPLAATQPWRPGQVLAMVKPAARAPAPVRARAPRAHRPPLAAATLALAPYEVTQPTPPPPAPATEAREPRPADSTAAAPPGPAGAAATPPAPAGETAATKPGAAFDGERHAPAAPAPAARTAPRADASWSGNTPPPYPAMARRLGEEGEVRLDVLVRRDGGVDKVRVKISSGSQQLDQTAIDTVKTWRFKPATSDGKPVDAWYYNWKWVFKLES